MIWQNREKRAGSGLNLNSIIDAATLPQSKTRKSSYGASFGDRVCLGHQPFWLNQNNSSSLAGRGYNCRNHYDHHGEPTEVDQRRAEREGLDSASSDLKFAYRDETCSTSSSNGKQTCNKSNVAIDHFRIVVMGDEYDGVKHKVKLNTRFSAACVFRPPEANQLALPDF